MVGWIQGNNNIYIEEDERKALLEIKASLHHLSNNFYLVDLLPTWVNHESTGGSYCNWERVICDATSTYVTEISLRNLFSMEDEEYAEYDQMDPPTRMIWPLNASLFLYFKELRSLDLSMSFIDSTFVSTGFKRLSTLEKLETLNLSNNYIETNIFRSLWEFTSLKILDLSYINGYKGYSPTHDVSEFPILENLEVLVLKGCGYYGTLQIQGLEKASMLRKLKILDLGDNQFDEGLLSSLSTLTSLKTLDLRKNQLSGLFPSQDCKSLMRLKKLESVSLAYSSFNKSIISCLSFLPSLNILDLRHNDFGSSFPMKELSSLRELKTLDLGECGFETLTINGTMSNLLHLNLDRNKFVLIDDIIKSLISFPFLRFLSLEYSFSESRGRLFANEVPTFPYLEVLILSHNNLTGTLPIKALSSFHRLKVLDLSYNNFVGSIQSTTKLLSSTLKAVSFTNNNGSLVDDELCELTNLIELDLSHNILDGNMPQCFNRLSSLKLLDISSNQFAGILLSSFFINLTSLKYVDFSHNKFEGSFSFSTFSNHTKLEFVQFEMDGDKFEVETEDPIGWIPMFQLKFLMLPNCNINRPKRSIVPSFLLRQHKLRVLDLSHNSLEGQLPNWLLKNNTKLELLKLRNNFFWGTVIHMGYIKAKNIRMLDISENHITGMIPKDIQKSIPRIEYLNFSWNAFNGAIPTSIGDLSELFILDFSNNQFSGEVPEGLLTNLPSLKVVKLSRNKLYGHILSRNLSFGGLLMLHLDGNSFTGNIGNNTREFLNSISLDISDNHFTGSIPSWISNIPDSSQIVMRNNHFEGEFPCGITSFVFLDISQNSFSGPLPSCLDLKNMEHLHMGYNKFTGVVPNAFRNLTKVLTLDLGHNYLSGKIPKFLGELSNLRILLLGNNKFVGHVPKQLCQLNNVSLIDLSENSLTGLIPRCLQNITGPKELAFIQEYVIGYAGPIFTFKSAIPHSVHIRYFDEVEIRDEALFTTKGNSLRYQGNILDYMSGLDLSCNKLEGEIPQELGMLTHILALNLSHNQLTGLIPMNLSNLAKIESLDLSSNRLIGNVPSELVKLTFLEVFNVSYNNLSGRLPELKSQFGTFTKESYKGNPLLCGPPLENMCTKTPPSQGSSTEEGTSKWYDMDKASFYGSSISTWFLFMLGFATVLYINPYWRRRWLEFVEKCIYKFYYFVYDL
ncbi:hypothetical protein SSX86_010200 [Deinandra increscens subsp. villosa]|uniref:Leucine-rich repeat-containing N-terminal plant-type domain-containing protein n=1 Tax=Deinandra increscens subsp. villosa TaxID=3103831 RepID=A0AAP0DEP6_9ASTR